MLIIYPILDRRVLPLRPRFIFMYLLLNVYQSHRLPQLTQRMWLLSCSARLLVWWVLAFCFISVMRTQGSGLLKTTLLRLAVISHFTFSVYSTLIFYILFEARLIPLIFSILGWGPQPERLLASRYILFYTLGCSLPFLSISLFYKDFIRVHPQWLSSMSQSNISGWMLLPFLVKLPIFMLHLWLPKAHVEAPTFSSIFLAGLLLKLSFAGFIRVYYFVPSQLAVVILSILLIGGALRALITLTLVDLKILIAYRSVFHMAPCATGLITGSWAGFYACLIILVGHGVVSTGLFFYAPLMYRARGTRRLVLNQGALVTNPSAALGWATLLVINISVPPLLGFIGEIIIFKVVSAITIIIRIWILVAISFRVALTCYGVSSLIHGASSLSFPAPQQRIINSYGLLFTGRALLLCGLYLSEVG